DPPPMKCIAPPAPRASSSPSRETIRIAGLTVRATVILLSAVAGSRFTQGKREGAVSRALSRPAESWVLRADRGAAGSSDRDVAGGAALPRSPTALARLDAVVSDCQVRDGERRDLDRLVVVRLQQGHGHALVAGRGRVRIDVGRGIVVGAERLDARH